MLKIKDNVDLKELEKFGFKPKHNVDTGELEKMIASDDEREMEIIKVYNCNRTLYYNYIFQNICRVTAEKIYDLIKADLVEKVDEQ